ncbi:unnamed protein product, partial [Rangifer tarandus platyrhynchus]|uniref:Uncharacterized protein n=3 Tax=Rangifer tarandus platyrhynchus TaxID=3082113 RepID=A0AC60A8I1_RANTA
MGPLKLVSGSEDVVNHRATLTSECNKERDSELLEQDFTLLEKEKKVKRGKESLRFTLEFRVQEFGSEGQVLPEASSLGAAPERHTRRRRRRALWCLSRAAFRNPRTLPESSLQCIIGVPAAAVESENKQQVPLLTCSLEVGRACSLYGGRSPMRPSLQEAGTLSPLLSSVPSKAPPDHRVSPLSWLVEQLAFLRALGGSPSQASKQGFPVTKATL